MTVTSFSTGPVDELNNSCIESQSCMCWKRGCDCTLTSTTFDIGLLPSSWSSSAAGESSSSASLNCDGMRMCVCVFKPFTVTSTHLLHSLLHKLNCL